MADITVGTVLVAHGVWVMMGNQVFFCDTPGTGAAGRGPETERSPIVRQVQHTLSVATSGQGLVDITDTVASWLAAQSAGDGLLSLFLRHTSASLLIQENADPDVLHDLKAFFHRLVPEESRLYRHTAEGPDDMPAHIKAALTQCHLSIPVRGGRMQLGTWQGIYVFEHRAAPHQRDLALHFLGQ